METPTSILFENPGYIDPPTHGISTPPTHGIWTPPIHGISTPLPMVYWPLYPWYFDPPTHGISNPLSMVFWPAYPWYIDPHTLPRWYIDPLTHVTLTPYTWYFDLPAYLLIKNGGFNLPYKGGQFSIRGFNIPWMKIDPGVNIPWVFKYHLTPVYNLDLPAFCQPKQSPKIPRSQEDIS